MVCKRLQVCYTLVMTKKSHKGKVYVGTWIEPHEHEALDAYVKRKDTNIAKQIHKLIRQLLQVK